MWVLGLLLAVGPAWHTQAERLILSKPSGAYTSVLIYRGDRLDCLGTILSDDTVLTAAHCVENGTVEEYTVVAGNLKSYLEGARGGAERLSLKSRKLHPYYPHEVPWMWDIAVVKLSTSIDLKTSQDVQAAVLPPVGINSKNKDLKGNFFDFRGNTLVQFGGIYDGCSDAFELGMFLGAKMYCGDGNNRCKKKSGAGAILPGWKKPIVLGVSTFKGTGCKTFPVFQEIESSLPWLYKETNIKPAYDVFNDDRFYSAQHIFGQQDTEVLLSNPESSSEEFVTTSPDCMEGCELMDTDLPGNDIENIFDVPSWNECSALCSDTPGCVAWTWVDERFKLAPSIVHKCHLKDVLPSTKQRVTGLISGYEGCRSCKLDPNTMASSNSSDQAGDDLFIYLGGGIFRSLPSFEPYECKGHEATGVLKGATGAVVTYNGTDTLMVCGGGMVECQVWTHDGWKTSEAVNSEKLERKNAASSFLADGRWLVSGGHEMYCQRSKNCPFHGHRSDKKLYATNTYSDEDGWVDHVRLPNMLSQHCQVTVGSKTYVIGGLRWKRSDKIQMLSDGKWTLLEHRLKDKKIKHACVEWGGLIYIIGGDGDNYCKNCQSVEVFNPEDPGSEDEMDIPQLPYQMWNMQALVHQDVLYAFGGREIYYNAVSRVYKLVRGATQWEVVPNVSYQAKERQIFPAPVISSKAMHCDP